MTKPLQDEVFDQLQRSNKLYALAYAKGYEDGVKYVRAQLEPIIAKLEKSMAGWKPLEQAKSLPYGLTWYDVDKAKSK